MQFKPGGERKRRLQEELLVRTPISKNSWHLLKTALKKPVTQFSESNKGVQVTITRRSLRLCKRIIKANQDQNRKNRYPVYNVLAIIHCSYAANSKD